MSLSYQFTANASRMFLIQSLNKRMSVSYREKTHKCIKHRESAYIALLKLVLIGRWLGQWSIASVALAAENVQEDVGICSGPCFLSGVDTYFVLHDCNSWNSGIQIGIQRSAISNTLRENYATQWPINVFHHVCRREHCEFKIHHLNMKRKACRII